LHTLFAGHNELRYGPLHFDVPVWQTLDPYALGIAVLAFVAYFGFKFDMLKTIGICVVAGLVVKWWV
jgi:chromate transporter